MERRSFLAVLSGALAAVATSTSALAAKKPANAIGKTTAFKVGVPVKMTASFKGVQRRVIVHRTSTKAFVVLDSRCTHEGCQVNLADAIAQCPCHLAQFDLTNGSNTVPPSGSQQVLPLRRYATAVKSGYLVFTK